jgi:hypothetical protein
MRLARWCVAMLALTACHRASGQVAEADASPSLEGPSGVHPARFSRPIAAAHGSLGSVMIAGLVASRGVIAVTDIGSDGATRWTVDVLSDVAWSPNTELRAFPMEGGIVVVYRGLRLGQVVTRAVNVDSKGGIAGPEFTVGGAACATDTALAWIDGSKSGGARVNIALRGQEKPEPLLIVPSEREPTLVCGSRRLFVLGEGEQDLTVAVGGAAQARVVLRDRDFADEEREHDTFSLDDTLGIVRVGKSGAIAIREISAQGIGSWRRLTTRLAEADDVVAVDADADASTVIFTRDDSGSCDGPSASTVRALRVPRDGTEEQTVDLSTVECGKDVGPFWTGAPAASFVVAWVERNSVRDPKAPPVVGIAYRLFTRSGLGELKQVTLLSDEIVDAGCDRDRCYAAALVRSPGTDDMQPEIVQAIAYP